ncbi:MAG: hypothetical protein JNM94_19185 [Phycisphaerae bacterium]|nr:hypothetical protein [Phycisphaerae bacterium]
MLPLLGSIDVTVLGSTPVEIHGDRYADLVVEVVGGGSGRERLRVAAHQVSRAPQPGDRLRVRFLLGQVDGVEILPETAP